jgi:hypothetical protein
MIAFLVVLFLLALFISGVVFALDETDKLIERCQQEDLVDSLWDDFYERDTQRGTSPQRRQRPTASIPRCVVCDDHGCSHCPKAVA